MKVLILIVGLSVLFPLADANSGMPVDYRYHSGLLNSRVLLTGDTSVSFTKGRSSDRSAVHDYGVDFKANPHIRLGIGGGYIQDSYGDDIDSWEIGGDVTFHALPKEIIDPYVTLGIGYQTNAVFEGEDEVIFDVESGVEAKAGNFFRFSKCFLFLL